MRRRRRCTQAFTLFPYTTLFRSEQRVGFFSAATDVAWVSVIALFRSEEHTSELQSRTLISYAVFCLKKKILQGRPYAQDEPLRLGLLYADGLPRCARDHRHPHASVTVPVFFFLQTPVPALSQQAFTLFPYTTLFR